MVNPKKARPPVAAAAAPVPASVPQAPTPAQAVLAVPARLPARQRQKALAIKPAAAPVDAPQAGAQETPSQPAPALTEKTAAAEKPRKSKRVRDSFSMPKAEYAVLDQLKQRAALLERPAKKNELVRAGVQLLTALSDAQFLAALAQLPSLKSDRTGAKP